MKKKSAEVCLVDYRAAIDDLRDFLAQAGARGLSKGALTRCYDYAVFSAYREFEQFVLAICIARINNDPTAFYKAVGVEFGRHITAAQSEYLLVGDGYFDFRGHGGLVEVLRRASGDSPMVAAAKLPQNRIAFEILVGLRNYVAHGSTQSWQAALKAMQNWEPDRKNLGSAGSWLKAAPGGQTRMERLLAGLDGLCEGLRNAA